MANIYVFSHNAGAANSSSAQPTLVGDALERARDEMEGRTGETDSEEDERE